MFECRCKAQVWERAQLFGWAGTPGEFSGWRASGEGCEHDNNVFWRKRHQTHIRVTMLEEEEGPRDRDLLKEAANPKVI